MLITKEVSVVLIPAIIKHYEDLGYVIPRVKGTKPYPIVKRGTQIAVKVSDLTNSSMVKIKIKCDYCGCIYESSYSNYSKRDKTIDKDACCTCAAKKAHEIYYLKNKEYFTSREDVKAKISIKQKIPYDAFVNQMKKHGYIILTTEEKYYNTIPLKNLMVSYRCEAHYDYGIQQTRINNLKYLSSSCKMCQLKKRLELSDLQRLKYDDVKLDFIKKGYILLDTEYMNAQQYMHYICKKHEDCGIQRITVNHLRGGEGCRHCMYENMRGNKSHLWKGGYSSLYIYLRGYLDSWIKTSLSIYNYKCVITGDTSDLQVHHLVSFNSIVKNILEELNIETKTNINMYSESEISQIVTLLLSKHNELYGVVLHKDKHYEFHSIYGSNNTIEQFIEFLRQNCEMNTSDVSKIIDLATSNNNTSKVIVVNKTTEILI